MDKITASKWQNQDTTRHYDPRVCALQSISFDSFLKFLEQDCLVRNPLWTL